MRYELTDLGRAGWWSATDPEWHLTLEFEAQTRLEKQRVITADDTPVTTELASALTGIADWLVENHADLVYPPEEYARIRIGRSIAAMRAERGWSQAELARRADLKQSHIARIERGMYAVTLDTLTKIASVFDKEVTMA